MQGNTIQTKPMWNKHGISITYNFKVYTSFINISNRYSIKNHKYSSEHLNFLFKSSEFLKSQTLCLLNVQS